MADLHRTQEIVSGLLTEVALLFKGRPKITLLVRHPELEAEGKDADFVMTDDTLEDAIVALQRRAGAATPPGDLVSREGVAYPVDERAFHVVIRDKGTSSEVFCASDRATLSSFPARDRTDAYAMVGSLNAIVRFHVGAAVRSLPAAQPGTFAEGVEAAARVCGRIAEESILVSTTDQGRARHEGIVAGAREAAARIRALTPGDEVNHG